MIGAAALVLGLVVLSGVVGGDDLTRVIGVELLFMAALAAAALYAVRGAQPA